MLKINRNKFLKLAGFAVITAGFGPFACSFLKRKKEAIKYCKNPKLSIVKPGFPGNRYVNDVFINEEPKPKIGASDILRWRFSTNPQKEEKKNDTFKLTVIQNNTMFSSSKDMIVWFGHASFFIRLDGFTFFTDPCLTDSVFLKRKAPLPCAIDQIRNIDYLLISHSHRDHLDSGSIESMDCKHTEALAPLKMGAVLKSMNKDIVIQEAGWYQKYHMPKNAPDVYLLPAQHWSQRSLWDVNRVLWGSYLIKGKRRSIYFAGDSAYKKHFSEIGKLFKKNDICIMPIAAYKPAYIMKGSHMTPEESVRAYHDLKGSTFLPMHYGTFDLADEPPGEPARKIKHMEKNKKIKGQVKMLKPGEVFFL